jgi:hypothetical protein
MVEGSILVPHVISWYLLQIDHATLQSPWGLKGVKAHKFQLMCTFEPHLKTLHDLMKIQDVLCRYVLQ